MRDRRKRSRGRSSGAPRRQLSGDSVEKLTAFQKNPENGSVSANFYSSACGNRTLMADFWDINLSRRVFQQYRAGADGRTGQLHAAVDPSVGPPERCRSRAGVAADMKLNQK
jgi:hypothetical protein